MNLRVTPNEAYGGDIHWNFPVDGGGALWTPAQLGAAVVGWWDASNFATITQVGGLVSAWASLAGGITANAAGAQRPTYSGTARNGKPGLTFAGAQIMNMSSVAAFNVGAGPIWLMATGYAAPGSAFASLVEYGANPANQNILVAISGIGTAEAYDVGFVIADPYVWAGADGCALAGATAGLGISIRCNGDVGADLANIFNLVANHGSIGNGLAGPFSGVIQEVIVINAALTASDLNKLAGYSMWKWGIQALLAPGNPYVTAPPTI